MSVKSEKDKVEKIDLNEVIKKTKATYAKSEAKLAANLFTTGTTVYRPSNDDDFLLWTGNDFWQKLTMLRGLPLGRITQISGKTNSGKSSLAAQFMKMGHDQGFVVILLDAERKFSAARFKQHMGGNPDEILLVNSTSIVEGAKAVASYIHVIKEINPHQKILLIWDSIGSSSTSVENESEDFSKQPGINAREVGWAVKKFNRVMDQYMIRETGKDTIATLLINQTYANIGSVGEKEKGGSELAYLSSLIINLQRKKDLVKVSRGVKYNYGISTTARIRKNHLFEGDMSVAEMDLVVYAAGVDSLENLKKNDKDIIDDDDSE